MSAYPGTIISYSDAIVAPVSFVRVMPFRRASGDADSPKMRLLHPGQKRGHAARVVVELRAEGLAKQFFLATDPDDRAVNENHNSGGEHRPPRHGEAAGHQHSEHAEIDRISHEAVRASGNQLVPFHRSRHVRPL